jgi:hypothetical protein
MNFKFPVGIGVSHFRIGVVEFGIDFQRGAPGGRPSHGIVCINRGGKDFAASLPDFMGIRLPSGNTV